MKKIILPLILISLSICIFSDIPKSVPKVHKNCVSTCHKPHNASGEKLTKKEKLDELCLDCHNSKDAVKKQEAKQLNVDPTYVSSHIEFREENPKPIYKKFFKINGKQYLLKNDCSGCHNPHLTNGEILKTFSFNDRGEIQSERRRRVGELCLGCHSGIDSTRTLRESDIGLLFSPSAKSKHTPGKSSTQRKDLPSLRINLNSKPVDCISCHNSQDEKGPHFSKYPSLLIAPYKKEYEITSDDDSGALCYYCHLKDSILSDESFPFHKEHITGFFDLSVRKVDNDDRKRMESFSVPKRKFKDFHRDDIFRGFGRPTACATCHNPHGSIDNPYLIEFDRSVVTYSSTGRIEYKRTGLHKGYCTLKCHDYDHIESEY
jgi:predicted CXXCH cytochrome family protein